MKKIQNRPSEWRGYTLDELKSRRIVTQFVLNAELHNMRQRLVPKQSSIITRFISKVTTQLTDLIPSLRKVYTLYRQIKDLFKEK
ncbi:MAG: hypothetical protein IKZ14_03350 [Muribaculaceae bacterium]|nr:hypothetical protein [Muribaculaceae bacterium]